MTTAPLRAVDRLAFLAPYYRYRRFELQKGALAEGAMPIDAVLHLQSLGWAWAVLAPALGFVTLAIGWLPHALGAMHSYSTPIPALGAVTAFCITGGADTIWRYFPANRADRRYWNNNGAQDSETERLVRKALTNDGILLIQIAAAVGLAFAWR